MAEPSYKSPNMDAALKNTFGFDRREHILRDQCIPAPIGCGGEATEFNTELNRTEYAISGLCQKCQDRIFKGETDGD